MAKETSITVKREVKDALDKAKKESDANNWSEFVQGLAEEEIGIDWDEVGVRETEEKVGYTRATIVAILETVEEMDLTEDILDIVEMLGEQNMLAKNQEIVDYLLQKAKDGKPLNETDRLLAEMAIRIEESRDEKQSPAAEIAEGLFAETDRATAKRRTKTESKKERERPVGTMDIEDHDLNSPDEKQVSET